MAQWESLPVLANLSVQAGGRMMVNTSMTIARATDAKEGNPDLFNVTMRGEGTFGNQTVSVVCKITYNYC